MCAGGIDVDGDHRLTAADPVSPPEGLGDYNQDGLQQANEVNSLAELGISVIDYANGSHQNGVITSRPASICADREGVITHAVNGGIVESPEWHGRELVIQVGDSPKRACGRTRPTASSRLASTW